MAVVQIDRQEQELGELLEQLKEALRQCAPPQLRSY
jgi:hypothetical protein